MHPQILNSKGEPIVLNQQEQMVANYLQQICNALGYEIPITTLTTIMKSVVEQKFFTIPFADYVPVQVGQGAWSADLLTYRDFSIGDDFSTGVLNTAAANSRFAEMDAAVDSISVPVINWGKQISWTIFDLNMAARSGNWDLVTSKERSRKKNWDLGIQKVAFLGLDGNANVRGLITQADVNANTSLITGYINAMNEANFQAFLRGIIEAYRVNAVRTAMPTHFIIPEADYNGLAVATSENFPLVSKLERLRAIFREITMNPNFKVLPCAYSDQATNADNAYLNKNRYTLLNFDTDSVRMDVPVPYTNTLQNTVNGAQFQNVGYGQFTGVKAYRPLEMLYLDWAA